MGTVARSRDAARIMPHTGLVRFWFLGPEKEIVHSGRLYTRKDAAIVYDALRAKYPEHDELELLVRVMPYGQVSPYEHRGVAAKRVHAMPIEQPEGEPFHHEIRWRGPRARVKAAGRLIEVHGEGEAPEKLSACLALFGPPAAWPAAKKEWL